MLTHFLYWHLQVGRISHEFEQAGLQGIEVTTIDSFQVGARNTSIFLELQQQYGVRW